MSIPEMTTLHQWLDASAQRRPDSVAVEMPDDGCLTYRALSSLSDRVRDRLRRMGVAPGDRVGICCPKSIDTVAAIFGALGAADIFLQIREIDELVSLAAKFICNHGWLRCQG